MLKADQRVLTPARKRKILERDDYVCSYCFGDADQVDHIIPWSYKRDDRETNLTACCWLCNLVGSNKVFDSIRLKQEHIQYQRHAYIKKRPIAIWTKRQLKEMGRTMRRKIEKTAIVVEDMAELKIVKRKLLEMELCVIT